MAESVGVTVENVKDMTFAVPTPLEPVQEHLEPLAPEPGEKVVPSWKLLPATADLDQGVDKKSRKKVYEYVCKLYGEEGDLFFVGCSLIRIHGRNHERTQDYEE